MAKKVTKRERKEAKYAIQEQARMEKALLDLLSGDLHKEEDSDMSEAWISCDEYRSRDKTHWDKEFRGGTKKKGGKTGWERT